MKLLYIIELSWRNLMSRKIRSLITISGVIIGITTIVFLTSLGYGVEKMTTSQIASQDALFVFDTGIEESDIVAIDNKQLAEIKSIENVAEVEAAVKLAGKISNGLVKTDVVIKGYSRKYIDLSQTKIYKGEKYLDKDKNKVLISTAAMKLMNISSNNDYKNTEISIESSVDQLLSPEIKDGTITKLGKFKTIGVIDDEASPFVIMPFEVLKENLSITNYNELKIRVNDKLKIQEARTKIEKMGFNTSYLGDTIKQINTIFVFFRYIIGGFGFIAMFVAILGMFNTLTVSLLERTREIGVLKANNATRRDIFLIFLTEALIISTMGGIFGVISGILTGKLVNTLFNYYAIRNSSDAIDLFYVPMYFIAATIIAVVFVGFLTGLYPARRATKIKILDALKYE